MSSSKENKIDLRINQIVIEKETKYIGVRTIIFFVQFFVPFQLNFKNSL